MRHSLVLALIVLSINACYYDVEEELYPVYCNTVQVGYEKDIAPFVQLRCATPGCHVAGGVGNGDLTSYEGLKEKVDNGSLRERVLVVGDMPDVGDLSACELDQLRAWLDDGARNN